MGTTELLRDLAGDMAAVISFVTMKTPRNTWEGRGDGKLYPSMSSVKSGEGSVGRRGTR